MQLSAFLHGQLVLAAADGPHQLLRLNTNFRFKLQDFFGVVYIVRVQRGFQGEHSRVVTVDRARARRDTTDDLYIHRKIRYRI